MLGPVDPVGAGDSLLAGIAAALAAGEAPLGAAELGNFAAAVTVQKLRVTGTASPPEILAIGSDPDYRYRPELALYPRRARCLEGTDIELAAPLPETVIGTRCSTTTAPSPRCGRAGRRSWRP